MLFIPFLSLFFNHYLVELKFNIYRVENILSGVSEQSKILYNCSEYVILPDMKWDLITVSSLYLVAIARDLVLKTGRREGELRRVRSMRDLRSSDLVWLKGIRKEAGRVVKEKWGLPEGSVRLYVHYQPSYCEPQLNFYHAQTDERTSLLQIASMSTL